jgi:putative membrane protein
MFDHSTWMFGGWFTMLIVWLVPFLLLFLFLKDFRKPPESSARELLDQAYARGELSREAYLQKRDDLAGR